MIVLLVMIQAFYCTNARAYTNIRSCGGGGELVFDSFRLQERIIVYTLVNCKIKLTYFISLYIINRFIEGSLMFYPLTPPLMITREENGVRGYVCYDCISPFISIYFA